MARPRVVVVGGEWLDLSRVERVTTGYDRGPDGGPLGVVLTAVYCSGQAVAFRGQDAADLETLWAWECAVRRQGRGGAGRAA